MEFIVELPKDDNKSIIMVIVDNFSNMPNCVPYNTHLNCPTLHTSSWNMILNYIAWLIPLWRIEILPSLVNFGKICLNYSEPN